MRGKWIALAALAVLVMGTTATDAFGCHRRARCGGYYAVSSCGGCGCCATTCRSDCDCACTSGRTGWRSYGCGECYRYGDRYYGYGWGGGRGYRVGYRDLGTTIVW